MSTSHRVALQRALRLALLSLGIATITWLLWCYRDDVVTGLAVMGLDVVWLALVYAGHLALAALGWRALAKGSRWWMCWVGVWISTSVNTLIPTGTIGGEVVKARVLNRYGAPTSTAIAAVLADIAAQGFSLIFWISIGLCALLMLDVESFLIQSIIIFTGLYLAGIGVFTWLQTRSPAGMLGLAMKRLTGPHVFSALTSAQRIDSALADVYETPWPMTRATLWRTAARLSLTMEVWLAAALMGTPVTLLEALVLKSVAGAARGAAFFVPNGIGVQEVVFVITANELGIDPGLAVAVSLAVRIRELGVSLPALALWYRLERSAER